ncbi:uncharacterized protein LOC114653417 isoform X1 [Erpetoichthys calabaricus]|uniref:uncharacterized protein LOC114653417 isoform X1 n=1 Tax=Erpetoichthys calabaricus TaxID=27687 RepID=UPI002234BAB6|nr:uncharacterized protein LOC114653417 isoform X1 [Erpetoichthys calabaricus]
MALLTFLVLAFFSLPQFQKAEVVTDFSTCQDFFYKKTAPAGFDQNLIKICQKYNDLYRYATLYSTFRRIPIYSAYTFDFACGNNTEGRRATWFIERQLSIPSDPHDNMDLPRNDREMLKQNQAIDRFYENTNYDRGHLNPNNFQCNDGRIATFTLTNAVPMDACFNRVLWKEYEDETRNVLERLRNKGIAYLVSGVVPSVNKIPIQKIDETEEERDFFMVTLPSHIWTAVCFEAYDTTKSFSFGYLGINKPDAIIEPMEILTLEEQLQALYENPSLNIFQDDCGASTQNSQKILRNLKKKIFLPQKGRSMYSNSVPEVRRTWDATVLTKRRRASSQEPVRHKRIVKMEMDLSFDNLNEWQENNEIFKEQTKFACVLMSGHLTASVHSHHHIQRRSDDNLICTLVPEKSSYASDVTADGTRCLEGNICNVSCLTEHGIMPCCTTPCLYDYESKLFICSSGNQCVICSPQYSTITQSGKSCKNSECATQGEKKYWCYTDGKVKEYCNPPHVPANLGPLACLVNTDKWLTFTADNGKLWCSKNCKGDACKIGVKSEYDDALCKYKASFSKSGNILLQDRRGMYLCRSPENSTQYIQAAKHQPDASCEFEVSVMNGKVLFKADNGKMLSRIFRDSSDNIEAEKNSPDVSCEFTVSTGADNVGPLACYIDTEKLVTFVADNGKFWCNTICKDDTCRIQVDEKYDDTQCKYKVSQARNGKILLQDRRGMYLCRSPEYSIEYIQAAKHQPDASCEFQVSVMDGNVLFKADNGKMLSRIPRGSEDNIEAEKASPDVFCKFTVHSGENIGGSTGRDTGVKNLSPLVYSIVSNNWITFVADNGKYWCNKLCTQVACRIQVVENYDELHCRYKVSQARNGKILLQDRRGMYLCRSPEYSIEYIQAAKHQPDASCEFQASVMDGNVLFKADNGKMLSRILRGSEDNIEAEKVSPDVFCKFTVHSGDNIGGSTGRDTGVDNVSSLANIIGSEKWITFVADNGKFWCHELCTAVSCKIKVNYNYDDTQCRYKLSQARNGKILLQDTRGMYLCRSPEYSINYIQAIKNLPDSSCEFQVSMMDGKVLFKADNGKMLSRILRGLEDNIEAEKASPDVFCQFTVIIEMKNVSPLVYSIVSNNWITFVADNGKYWCNKLCTQVACRIQVVENYDELHCRYKVSQARNGKILLQDRRGMYLCRSTVNSIQYIQAAKHQPDASCEFQASVMDGNMLFKADNGKMLSRILRGLEDNIEAEKDSPDIFSKFTVNTGVTDVGPLACFINTEKYITFMADNGGIWCNRLCRGDVCRILVDKAFDDKRCMYKVSQASNGKILLQNIRGMYLCISSEYNISYIKTAKHYPDATCEFEVFVEDGKLHFKASNGRMLSRIYRGQDNIEAEKPFFDHFGKFTVIPQCQMSNV